MVTEVDNFHPVVRIFLPAPSIFLNTLVDILTMFFYKMHVYLKGGYFPIKFEYFESLFFIFSHVFSKGLLFLLPFLVVDYKRVEKLIIYYLDSTPLILFLNQNCTIKNNILKFIFQLINIKLWLSKFVIYYRLSGFSKLNILLNGTCFLNKLGFAGFWLGNFSILRWVESKTTTWNLWWNNVNIFYD